MPRIGRTIWKVRITPRSAISSGIRPEMRSPLNATSPAVGFERAGDQIEAGGLAGAVGTDHREDFALAHVEADVLDGDQTAKRLGEIADRKHHLRSLDRRWRTTRGQMPSGRKVMTSRMTTP